MLTNRQRGLEKGRKLLNNLKRCAAVVFLLAHLQSIGQIKCEIHHYSTEDGLSHYRVLSMLKDHEGFMWFGTWDGINRFDGHNFVAYKSHPGDRSALRNHRIDEIAEDKTGYLWLRAYDNQIYRFDKKKEQFLAVSEAFREAKKTKLVFDKILLSADNGIWLRTKNQGLFFLRHPGSPLFGYIRYSAESTETFRLPSNTINFFYEDKQHKIWIGTPAGLACLARGKDGIYRQTLSGPSFAGLRDYTAIAENQTTIWLTTRSGSLVSYEKSARVFSGRKISGSSLNAVNVAHSGKALYISTANSELLTVTLPGLTVVTSRMPGTGPFYSLYEDRSGGLWIEPEKHGVIRFTPAKNAFRYFSQENDGTNTTIAEGYRVFEDTNGRVWTNMKGGGFGYYNPLKDSINYFYDEPNPLNHKFSNMVNVMVYDKAGILWLCTEEEGINKIIFQKNDFTSQLLVDHTFIRSDNEVRGMYCDPKNRLWLGAKSGKLYVYQNGKRLKGLFVNEPAGGLGLIYSILRDHRGNMWFGTKANGLYRAEPLDSSESTYKLSHYQRDKADSNSLSSNVVYSIFEDKKNRIWVGTYENGLNEVVTDHGRVKFYNARNAFKNYPKGAFAKIRHLARDAAGRLWIGTTSGLLVLDADHGNEQNYRFANFTKIPGDRESLGNNDVQFIYRDSRNTMWVCTAGGGLNRAIGMDPFKGLKFNYLTIKDGLPSDFILSCAEDNDRNLWLSTQNGLAKYSIDKRRFRNYDSYDGLSKTRFSEAAGLKLANGNLAFGAIAGWVSFNPRQITDNKIRARMVLTNLEINNKEVVSGDKSAVLKQNINDTQHIFLRYDENIVSIEYTVLDFRSTNKQTYAYRLKGFETTWTNNKTQRRATYTNLPPGNYVFEVQSTSNELYTNTPLKTLSITILPPPWKTWWACLLYFLLGTLLIEAIRRTAVTLLRLKHNIVVEQKMAALKLSFFTNVSHELRTPLTLILNPIEEINKREDLSQQGKEYIEIVKKNANRMVRFINQLLDLRKVQSGRAQVSLSRVEMVSFVKKISDYFTDVAREKGIELCILTDNPTLFAWIDAEKIDIVIYNLLANAFKFTPRDKKIEIRIRELIVQHSFLVEICDQGEGVAHDQLSDIFELYYEGEHTEGKNLKGTGIGLALSKELVELHHGKISATNNPNGGLTVSIELKLGKEHFKNDEIQFIDLPEVAQEAEIDLEELWTQPAPKIPEHADRSAPLVLLVEDNMDLRAFLGVQLNQHYRVEVAEDGEEGLRKALELLPDLVLSDVMMPKMDGIQLLDQLKNNPATSHIPVVLLSARFSVESQINGLNFGADYYITKPFHNDFLLASIQNLLEQRKKLFQLMVSGKKTIALQPGEIVITPMDELFLKKVIAVVEEGMADPEFNIEAFAESVNMSRSAFFKKFKSLTNLAPVEFVRDMRLKRAKQFIEAGEYSISSIAYSVGFNNAKYFSTCFREQYGVSPTEYVKKHKVFL